MSLFLESTDHCLVDDVELFDKSFNIEEFEDEEDRRSDVYQDLANRHYAWRITLGRVQCCSTELPAMLTERDLISHDDYENFAKYLGVDYEDFCELFVPESDVDDSELVGISNTQHVPVQ